MARNSRLKALTPDQWVRHQNMTVFAALSHRPGANLSEGDCFAPGSAFVYASSAECGKSGSVW